jgi:hypothetical protein
MEEAAAGSQAPWYRRYGWAVPFALGALLGLFGTYPLFTGADPDDFESSTGVSWEALSSTSPDIANYIDRLEQLIGVAAIGFGAWAAFVAFAYLKKGDRAAWRAMWLVPIVLGGSAAVFFLRDAVMLGSFYLAAVLVSLVGQVLSNPPKNE